MIDYSCLLAERFLQQALDDPRYLTMAAVRRDFLAGPASDDHHLLVPFNKVMIATFYLTGMDIAHRLITWLDAAGVDWEQAMVIFAGQAGRPTAGVTEESHSIAGVVRAVSRGRLAPDRVFIAPHAPVFAPYRPPDTCRGRGPGNGLPPAVGRPARHVRAGRRHVRRLPALRRPVSRASNRRARPPRACTASPRWPVPTTGSLSSRGCAW